MRTRSAFLRLSALLGVVAWLGLGLWEEADARAGGAGGGSSSSSGSKSSGGSSGRSSGSRSSGGSGSWGGGSKSSGSSGSKSSSYGSSRNSSSYSGGYSSGSGGESFSDSFLWDLIKFLFGGGLLIGGIVAFYWIGSGPGWRLPWRKRETELLFPYPPAYRASGLDEFLAANPDFDRGVFGLKVRTAFMKIQRAWTDQDISPVRRFISDGIYQRFTAQFRMMGLLKQRNVLDEIRIHDVRPVAYRLDGPFDVIDVWICAQMSDSFVCKLDRSMNSKGHDPFAEYWSFIRKRGAGDSGVDLFSGRNCPSCGAELPGDMGELCRCAHCQVMVNSGEFDWVLAEIAQEEDYCPPHLPVAGASAALAKDIAALARECPDFSRQMTEDKASNAFMQIMTAYATRNPASIRRFVTDGLFAAISAKIPDRSILFNRLYLNESILLKVARADGKHRLVVGMAACAQRVELLPSGKLSKLDREEQRMGFTLTLERDIDAVPEKGSLYQHQCAACGGAVADTPDVTCQYCGSALNSTRHEWIVCGFEAR